ncbi:hypothetical protein CALVIDRAFT_533828 [Calocera viscosa TUFC12733]|uniref:Uncharacterized protein n=1 Tax=Calocera viscosa (strain TUFC12733) TaxID=1330018 RepID=A0A167QRV7_CALVF|nr:hypothetical protein CALVIDRAFT_533828 [Calocera viscosa TUFC12733]
MATSPRSPSPTFDQLTSLFDQAFGNASSLVSSWISEGPRHGYPAQAESEELLRQWRDRPARLGLGAPVRRTDSAPLSQLNRHLAAGTRKRKGGDEKRERNAEKASDEDQESRYQMSGRPSSAKKRQEDKWRVVLDLARKKKRRKGKQSKQHQGNHGGGDSTRG